MFARLPLNLESERLVIRRFTEADLPHAYELHCIDAVNRYLPYTTWTAYSDALAWHDRVLGLREQQSAEQYAIVLKSTQTFIGTCIVFGFDTELASAEFGYVLHPDHWGQGYMLEAMTVFTESLAVELSLKQLNASVEEPNHASKALLKKLKFSLLKVVIEEDGTELGKWTKTYSNPAPSC